MSSQANAKGNLAILTGRISDSMCDAKHMMSGNDAKCVRACVKNGSQYALVVDQKIYSLKARARN
jgi:hypothetical protein